MLLKRAKALGSIQGRGIRSRRNDAVEKERILVVDDEELILDMVSKIMRPHRLRGDHRQKWKRGFGDFKE